MRWRQGYIAVDWGTTNRRAYAVAADGALEREFDDDLGVLAVPAGGFEAAVADIRARLGERPMLMAGMVGSNRGWAEAAYAPCPAGVDELVAGIRWMADDVGIVPGVSFSDGERADVMRGEEVQLVGAAAAGLLPEGAAVCHPGTHAKWIAMEDGRIGAFRTRMTGEIFALLREHSILADQLRGRAGPGPAFAAGVRRAREGDGLLAELFGVRARYLLGKAGPEEGPSYASGLLIGADVCAALEGRSAMQVVLVGRPELTALYAAALAELGHGAVEIDGATALLAGMAALVERL